MKYQLIFYLLVLTILFSCSNASEKNTVKYVVNKTTSGCKCTVQTTTERPQLGSKIFGPFDTKDEAIEAMCNDIDPTASDPSKCWEATPKCK